MASRNVVSEFIGRNYKESVLKQIPAHYEPE